MKDNGDLPVEMVTIDDDPAPRVRRGSRPRDPRWRWIGVAGVLAAAVTVVVINRQPTTEWQSAPAPVLPPATSTPAHPTSPPDDGRSWTLVTRPAQPAGVAADSCGTRAPLPRVVSEPLREKTGLQLVIGAAGVLDVDSHDVARDPVALDLGDQVRQVLTAGSNTYLVVGTCRLSDPARVLSVDDTGRIQEIAVPLTGDQVLGRLLDVGGKVWASVESGSFNRHEMALAPLDGGNQVPLPSDFWAFAGVGDLVVGRVGEIGFERPIRVELFDPTTGQVVHSFRPVSGVGVGADMVIWTGTGCGQACPLQIYRADTGLVTTSAITVPVDFDLNGSVVSGDGRSVASVVPLPATVGRGGVTSGAPAQIEVLDLDSGDITPVPGIELADRYAGQPSLAYSADSRWLVIGVPTSTGSEVLLWRPGLTTPAEAAVTSDASSYPPPLAVSGR